MLEGFYQADCDVVPFQLDATRTLDVQIDALGIHPDLIFLQLFGKTNLPKEIFKTKYKIAAYCIDSFLNEYWLIPLTKMFDFVYVDQLSSVPKFRKHGVQAKWLPLCVSATDFREKTEIKHFVTFVGRLTPHRVKRHNMIELVAKHFPVHIVQDVSRDAMQDLFAASRVVLNENFFSGLNLRFFQALASGALLLTERSGYGVSRHFREGEHFVGYAPNDLLATLGAIAENPEAFRGVAERGQAACRRHHTSLSRALTVLEDLTADRPRAPLPLAQRECCEAQGKYYHAIRFGGAFDEAVRLFQDVAQTSGGIARLASCRLGDIYLRSNKKEEGISCLEKCAVTADVDGICAILKLMLLHIDDKRFFYFLSLLMPLIIKVGLNPKKYIEFIDKIKNDKDRYYDCCLLGCHLLLDLNRNFALGFAKPYEEPFPDYAMEYAQLAFSAKKTEQALDLLIKCTAHAGIAPEALPYVKQAVAAGVASDEQIAHSAALAVAYYDFSYARMAVKALRKTLS